MYVRVYTSCVRACVHIMHTCVCTHHAYVRVYTSCVRMCLYILQVTVLFKLLNPAVQRCLLQSPQQRYTNIIAQDLKLPKAVITAGVLFISRTSDSLVGSAVNGAHRHGVVLPTPVYRTTNMKQKGESEKKITIKNNQESGSSPIRGLKVL